MFSYIDILLIISDYKDLLSRDRKNVRIESCFVTLIRKYSVYLHKFFI